MSEELDLELAAKELEKIELEVARRRHESNPALWAKERLGDTLWSGQERILNALRDHRRVAVQSCHEIGKSYIASVATGWWIDVHKDGEAFVVTSAPSGPQVRTILWREIGRVHTRGKLKGRINQTEWILQMGDKEEQVAIGRKPNDYDPTSFQGLHARYFMYIFDEACGMPRPLWEAADSLIANERGRALVFGNPDDPTSEFAEICKPGSGWHVIQIGAFDTPNFTGEDIPKVVKEQLIGRTYVEERRRKWASDWRWNEEGTRCLPPEGKDPGETGMIWQSKVLGLFPIMNDEGGLLPMLWVRRAMERSMEATGPREIGLDVGAGGDASCGCQRDGPVVRILWEDQNPDTMQTTGKLIKFAKDTGASHLKIDIIGVGRGVTDRAKELVEEHGYGFSVEGIGVGERAVDEKNFANRRSELWWHVRTLFETNQIDIDPDDEDLQAQLVSLRYKRMSNGKIQIESKDDAKKRGIPSPNRADALMLAVAPGKPKVTRATWGSRRFKGRRRSKVA